MCCNAPKCKLNKSPPWHLRCQALRSAGGLLLQREVPEGVNTMFATYARAAGIPACHYLLG